jgi:hypothetical protein
MATIGGFVFVDSKKNVDFSGRREIQPTLVTEDNALVDARGFQRGYDRRFDLAAVFLRDALSNDCAAKDKK